MNRWLTTGLPLALVMGVALNAHALPDPDKKEKAEKKIEKRVVIAVKADDGKVEFVGPGDVTKSIDIERMLGDKLPALLGFLPEDGEVKVEVRAVVVKPDGKKRTIVWEQLGGDGEDVDIRVVEGDDEPASEHGGDDHPNLWIARAEAGGEFMIGVGCEPVGEALRSQLRLGDEGLLVSAVFDGTPADKAGLREYDVIVAANGEEIEDLSDLIAAVQEAGEKEVSLALKIIRRGESKVVKVEPAPREKAEGYFQKMIEERLREAQQQQSKLRPEIAELLKKRVLHLEMDDDEHEHDGHHEHADDDEDEDEDDHEDVISELREQVEELQEAVEQLQEAFEEMRDDDEL